MPKRVKVNLIIDNITYTKKKDIAAAIQAAVDKREPLRPHDHVFKILIEVMRDYPGGDERNVETIHCFTIVSDAGEAPHIEFFEQNGHCGRFSWKKRLAQYGHGDTLIASIYNEWLVSAYRGAIVQQKLDFKDRCTPYCHGCQELIEDLALNNEVHHVSPIKELIEHFENGCEIETPTRFIKLKEKEPGLYSGGVTHTRAFHPDDIEYERAWQEFHKKEAVLVLLCKPCHDKLTYGRQDAEVYSSDQED